MLKSFFIMFFLLSLPVFSYAEDMIIKLPNPKEESKVSLEESIKRRRSERNLSGKGLRLEQIGQLLWSCQGITHKNGRYRSAPSAGATYPLEIYLVAGDGMFHYIPETHSIKRIKDMDLRGELSLACLGQDFVKDAAIDIIICADFERTTGRYGERGKNYVYIEVGHAAENLHLQAAAEGLGSVPVGAFSDSKVKKVMGLSKELVPIYVVPVGYIKK
jgi:SagB-type dehydrogenase family enzyme